jgi:hypothetical protein
MTRRCDWCGHDLPADAPESKETCDAKCRNKRHRFRHGVTAADGTIEPPPPGSPLLAREARSNGAKKASGLQVSYPKALDAATKLARRLGASEVEAPKWARAFMVEALPAKQLERLEARTK